MTTYLRVFGQAHRIVNRTEIADSLSEGVYFDEPLTVEVADVPGERVDDEWTVLHIRYHAARRPIILHMTTGGPLFGEEVTEAIEALAVISSPRTADLVCRLSGTSIIYAFEVDERNLTEDAWGLVDALEAYLARRCEGIVYAPDDGFFDADLNRLVALR
ncbi:MAG: hypothetical protein M3450_05165 [Actinomycetota bacterium]|nr:hypothetical protein [Actinomycetota bacterium]